MRILDKLKLILRECRYEKSELVLSVVQQILTFSAVCFMFTIFLGMDNLFGKYMMPLYDEGYCFSLEGYTEDDMKSLEDKGFYNFRINNEGEIMEAYIKDTNGIWIYKLQAVLDGKDIWNEALEEILGVMLFCQIITGAIGVALFIIMLNNLSNSFAMKLIERKNYISMLYQLGCSKYNCKSIYYGFFVIRNVLALILASVANCGLIMAVNNYLQGKIKLNNSFSLINPGMIIGILLLSIVFMLITFEKQWRRIDETVR